MTLDEFKSAVLEVCPKAIFDTFTPGRPLTEEADFIFAYSNKYEHLKNCSFASFTGGGSGSTPGMCDVFQGYNWTFKDTVNLADFKEMLKKAELEPSKHFPHLSMGVTNAK